ncbi:MAG: hypothetical protein QOG01_840 [Pseudonocardiales bacterium]|jgi:uncharacterized protein (TIGR03083 family)|nr:hypothetical protein [Pseudonocardiales bacterium]
MDTGEIFAACAAQRRAFADLIETLDDAQLATPSLCGEWDVRTVAAHLTVPLLVPTLKFARAALRHGGSFDRTNAALAKQMATTPVSRIAANLRAQAESRYTPPVGGPRAPLSDLLIHGGDVRIPLGLPFDPPVRAVETALDFLTGLAIGFVPRGRLKSIRIAPTDSPRRWGSGGEITGRAADLMMAAGGRTATLDQLAGPGLDMLAGRR